MVAVLTRRSHKCKSEKGLDRDIGCTILITSTLEVFAALQSLALLGMHSRGFRHCCCVHLRSWRCPDVHAIVLGADYYIAIATLDATLFMVTHLRH